MRPRKSVTKTIAVCRYVRAGEDWLPLGKRNRNGSGSCGYYLKGNCSSDNKPCDMERIQFEVKP